MPPLIHPTWWPNAVQNGFKTLKFWYICPSILGPLNCSTPGAFIRINMVYVISCFPKIKKLGLKYIPKCYHFYGAFKIWYKSKWHHDWICIYLCAHISKWHFAFISLPVSSCLNFGYYRARIWSVCLTGDCFHSLFEPPHDKTKNDLCIQLRLRSAWASTQSDQSLYCPHDETLGPQLPIERTAKTLIRLGRCPGWSESLLGTHVSLLVLSWGGSF